MNQKIIRVGHINLNEAYQKMLIWFFCFPDKEFSLNEISNSLNISKTTANKVIKELKNEGFLSIEVLGKIWRISSNRYHFYNFSRKISYNLMMLYNSGIIEEIKKSVGNPRAIILFGSYRKGDDNEKSDIDIAVEVLGNKEPRIIEFGVIDKFLYRKNVVINLHIFSRNKVDLNLFSNIANGIILDGFLEVKIWISDTRGRTKRMR